MKPTSKKNTQLSDDAEYWRKLAEAARSKANRISNPRSKQTMLKVAHTYERRADQAEKKKPPGALLTHKFLRRVAARIFGMRWAVKC